MENLLVSSNQPTKAYKTASIATLVIGVSGFLLGLWNAELLLSEKGFYLAIFLLALFSAITLQKSVRDKEEGIAVTKIYMAICWGAFAASLGLLAVGLINAEMLLSEKGFYGMAFVLSLFAVVTVQKNARDVVETKVDTKVDTKNVIDIDADNQMD